jgi:hypothetical protein
MSTFRWTVSPGDTIRVYRNLHRACWSVQTKVKVNRSHIWKVAGWADAVAMENAVFVVYEKGRQRVLATGQKNVHSFVLGRLVTVDPFDPAPEASTEVTYNPRKQPHFYDLEQPSYPLVSARRLWLSASGRVYAEGVSE